MRKLSKTMDYTKRKTREDDETQWQKNEERGQVMGIVGRREYVTKNCLFDQILREENNRKNRKYSIFTLTLKWTKEKLRQMEQRTRNSMTLHKAFISEWWYGQNVYVKKRSS